MQNSQNNQTCSNTETVSRKQQGHLQCQPSPSGIHETHPIVNKQTAAHHQEISCLNTVPVNSLCKQSSTAPLPLLSSSYFQLSFLFSSSHTVSSFLFFLLPDFFSPLLDLLLHSHIAGLLFLPLNFTPRSPARLPPVCFSRRHLALLPLFSPIQVDFLFFPPVFHLLLSPTFLTSPPPPPRPQSKTPLQLLSPP